MHTFTKTNESEVVSSEGFRIKCGPNTLTYAENDRYLLIPVEHSETSREVAVHVDLIGSWTKNGYRLQKVTHTECRLVMKRIAQGLAFLGMQAVGIEEGQYRFTIAIDHAA